MPSTAISAATHPSKGLNIALWVVQVLLFLDFAAIGLMKLVTPIEKMPMPAEMGPLIKFIGISEVAGALGVLLPSVTRIKPMLAPLAALGILAIMILAVGFHLQRGDASHIGTPICLGIMAAFVAWGRWKKVPIAPRA